MPAKAKLSPFHNNLLLKEIEASDKTTGGLIIPEAHRAKLNQGEVMDKGPNASDAIEIGMIVFFPLHTESRMEWKGNRFIIVAEDACLGAISEIHE